LDKSFATKTREIDNKTIETTPHQDQKSYLPVSMREITLPVIMVARPTMIVSTTRKVLRISFISSIIPQEKQTIS